MGHDLLTTYWLKGLEYLLALSYLPLFVLFWKFAAPRRAPEPAAATAPGWADQLAGCFRLPGELYFHPGHVWARVDGPDTVTVGMDDFAQRLVGRIDRLGLPAVGAAVTQGSPALSLHSGAKGVEMLSPVTGTVLEVNHAAARSPEVVKQSPYGEGWLFRVLSPQLASNLKSLMTSRFARCWLNTVTEQLGGELGSKELGFVYADGGTPIDGIAHSLSPDHWDELARRYFRTDQDGGAHA